MSNNLVDLSTARAKKAPQLVVPFDVLPPPPPFEGDPEDLLDPPEKVAEDRRTLAHPPLRLARSGH